MHDSRKWESCRRGTETEKRKERTCYLVCCLCSDAHIIQLVESVSQGLVQGDDVFPQVVELLLALHHASERA